MAKARARRPLFWMGSSLDDLTRFPDHVKRVMGFALHFAQAGGRHPDAKPLKGFAGAGVLEVVEERAGDMSTGTTKTTKSRARGAHVVREGSGNIFADLQLSDSGEALAKAELATQIASAIADRRLTQVRAAELLGVNQADVSDLVRGKLRGFSTGRLLRFLNALGRDIEIVVHARRRTGRSGRLRVIEEVHNAPEGRGTGKK